MSPDAYITHQQQKHLMTREEIGVSSKKIIIPSFDTTSKIFSQHFQILRELKHKIDLLKQAYEDQRSIDRSWEQIDAILNVLSQGCYYLDFHDEQTIKKMMREMTEEEKKEEDPFNASASPLKPFKQTSSAAKSSAPKLGL